jgi:hypothetical protein
LISCQSEYHSEWLYVSLMFVYCKVSHNNLNRWKNYSQLLNVRRVSDVRQIEIHTAELLVPDPSSFEVETAIAELKMYKSPGNDQFLQN